MMPFELATPASLAEAISLLDPEDAGIRPIGGGTAVMLMMKAGVLLPTRLVSLAGIEPEYSQIELTADGELQIGGMTRLAVLERSSLLREWPMLARALVTLSNIRVRNVATVGGALAHADPHMDLPPVLSALDARVVVVGPKGERSFPVIDLCTGYYETVLDRDELIAKVIVPKQGTQKAHYLKCTTRAAHDWPALGLAVSVQLDGDVIGSSRLILGAATDRPTRLTAAEAQLQGAKPEAAVLKRAGEAAIEGLDIVGDMHGSSSYKKHLLRIQLGRAVQKALAGATSGDHA